MVFGHGDRPSILYFQMASSGRPRTLILSYLHEHAGSIHTLLTFMNCPNPCRMANTRLLYRFMPVGSGVLSERGISQSWLWVSQIFCCFEVARVGRSVVELEIHLCIVHPKVHVTCQNRMFWCFFWIPCFWPCKMQATVWHLLFGPNILPLRFLIVLQVLWFKFHLQPVMQ